MNEHNQQVIGAPAKSSALKMTGSGAAWVNAASIAVATFFGAVALFGAIALFTKGKWIFDMPGVVSLFSETSVSVNGNLSGAFGLLMTAAIAVLGGVMGMISLRKITDINAMKKSWSVVMKVFVVLALLYAVEAVVITIYGLMGLGKESGVDQGYVWLSGLLPAVVKCAVAGVIALIGKKVSEGKTEVLRVMSFVAMGIAAVALILAFISILVGFYAGGRSSSSYGGYSWSDILDY